MKHLLTVWCLVLLVALPAFAQFPEVTIRQIQEVPLESLLIADSLGVNSTQWQLQTSSMYGDTVTIRALCLVPAKVLTFTQRGWTMLLLDTVNWAPWGGILVRVGNATDTSQAILDGFLNVEQGDIIQMTGKVDEFPAGYMNSMTQFVPIPGQAITIVGAGTIPQPVDVSISDFYQGLFPGGKAMFSTGEPYEGLLVRFHAPLTVDARVSGPPLGRGTFSMVDGSIPANQVADYDASKYFTLKGSSTDHPGADSIWSLIYPVVGTMLDSIQGYMTTVSGMEGPRGYRIAPIYRGDVSIGLVLPSVTQHRRNPIIVPPDSAARISVRVSKQQGGYGIQGVRLSYSLNWAPFTSFWFAYSPSDTLYKGNIPIQPANTFVRYFIQAMDSAGNFATLASSAFGGASSDTSKGFFFYTVLNRPLTIHDLQYTPFQNGRTPYLGATVSDIRGIVTADTANIMISPLNSGGTNAWYMQTSNQPWNGIWVVGAESTMASLRNGDSIGVTGSLTEQYDVTQIYNVENPVTVYSTGNAIPEPIDLTTGQFAISAGNGDPAAEPYESMLIRLSNLRVSNIYPVFSDPSEYEVDDGSGAIIVRRDGTNTYSNEPADSSSGKTILKVGDPIYSMTGILYYSYNRYKIAPRTNADFTMVAVPVTAGWNMISNPITTEQDSVQQLFPTSSFPYAFSFSGTAGYQQEGRMRNGAGYWGKFPGDALNHFTATLRTSDSVTVTAGWNMVGSISTRIDTASITSYPAGIRTSQWFGYNGGYAPSRYITPGRAYWVKTSSAGKFYFSALSAEPPSISNNGGIERLSSVTITDARGASQTLYFGLDERGEIALSEYVMPPAPPAGTLDARFESVEGGLLVRTIGVQQDEAMFPISVSADAYPLQVSWDIKGEGASATKRVSYELSDGLSGAAFQTKTIAAQGTMRITHRGVNQLILKAKNSKAVPLEFALEQNYPNPFNPTTAVRYTVPQMAHVSLRVYNILGQEVKTLVDDIQEAGVRTVQWNSTNNSGKLVGSGVYFYQLKAGEMTSTRKMVLLK